MAAIPLILNAALCEILSRSQALKNAERVLRKEGIGMAQITLKAARVNAGLTQKQAAEALGVKKGTILNYEKYRTKPDIEMAKKIAVLYGCTVDDIIFFAE